MPPGVLKQPTGFMPCPVWTICGCLLQPSVSSLLAPHRKSCMCTRLLLLLQPHAPVAGITDHGMWCCTPSSIQKVVVSFRTLWFCGDFPAQSFPPVLHGRHCHCRTHSSASCGSSSSSMAHSCPCCCCEQRRQYTGLLFFFGCSVCTLPLLQLRTLLVLLLYRVQQEAPHHASVHAYGMHLLFLEPCTHHHGPLACGLTAAHSTHLAGMVADVLADAVSRGGCRVIGCNSNPAAPHLTTSLCCTSVKRRALWLPSSQCFLRSRRLRA